MENTRNILSAAILSGSIASLVSAGALALLAKAEGRGAAQPSNATSHWLHGESAGSVELADLPHTALGYASHHVSSVLWAFLFEGLRSDTATGLASIARDASVTAAVAGVTDYVLMPRRLTPGWEAVLPARSVAAGFGALALGLTLGGLATRSSRQCRHT